MQEMPGQKPDAFYQGARSDGDDLPISTFQKIAVRSLLYVFSTFHAPKQTKAMILRPRKQPAQRFTFGPYRERVSANNPGQQGIRFLFSCCSHSVAR